MHTPYPSIKKEPVTKGSMAIQIPAYCLFYYKQKGGKPVITGIWCKKHNSFISREMAAKCEEAGGDGIKVCYSGKCQYSTRAIAANVTGTTDKTLMRTLKKLARRQKV